jgi:nucleoside-diphosphate-sugar epimerase
VKLLITGASGFVGRRLVERLAAEGHEVLALVHTAPAPPFASSSIRPLVVDLAHFERTRLPSGVDAVVSLAQSQNFRSFPGKAADVFAVNVNAHLQLLEWARGTGVRVFVSASSGGIYGARSKPLVEETDQLAVDSPLGFYLGTKLCAEVILQNYRHFFGCAAILRPFFIYGPGQRQDMLIPRLIGAVRDGRPIQLQGSDGLRLNPVYVDDAVKAFAAAIELQGCHVINVAGPDTLSLREIGERVGRRVGRAPVFELIDGSPSSYVGDIGHMRALLGAPRTGFDEGIARTLEQR